MVLMSPLTLIDTATNPMLLLVLSNLQIPHGKPCHNNRINASYAWLHMHGVSKENV